MKNQVQILRFGVGAVIILLFVYTRFFGISWGLPYPMHPDERNMAVAVQQLACDAGSYDRPERLRIDPQASLIPSVFDTVRIAIRDVIADCYHPNFFAYGQFPLYVAYGGIIIFKVLTGTFSSPITFSEATGALRLMSACASVGVVFFVVQTVRFVTAGIFANTKPFEKDTKKEDDDQQEENQSDESSTTAFSSIERYAFYTGTPLLVVLFTPGLIQSAHFGTTESLLMFCYTGLVYLSIRLIYQRNSVQEYIMWASVLSGMAIASKLTGMTFLAIPGVTLIMYYLFTWKQIKKPYLFVGFASSVLILSLLTVAISTLLSPYNVLAYDEFLGSMQYESDVAFGSYVAFYTRQFEQTTPVVFQFIYTLPFALGFIPFLLMIVGFIGLSWKRKDLNLIRFAIVIYAIPQLILFAKWTRFLAPVFPLMVILTSIVLVYSLKGIRTFLTDRKVHLYPAFSLSQSRFNWVVLFLFYIVLCAVLLPGIGYLSVYTTQDVRFSASEWVYENIPANSYILSETANVIDIPVPVPGSEEKTKQYAYRSFNFYDLDLNVGLQDELEEEIAKADYIFVPSRRIFANHTCLRPEDYQASFLQSLYTTVAQSHYDKVCAYRMRAYPKLNQYYDQLFSGELGFEHVATFHSYPRVGIGDRTLVSFPDEDAEETWTVFDHPVVRIYAKPK
jgi:hypothetical protein